MTPANQLLFVATFADGNQYFQGEHDQSTRGGANAFSDVMAYTEEVSPLISFVLLNSDQTISYGVDLQDGHFEVNGVPFFAHRFDQKNLRDFRVIYFRTPQIHFNVGETGSPESVQGLAVSYTLGWQANDPENKNVQRVIKTPVYATYDLDTR